MTVDEERRAHEWQAALDTSLADAIVHLQILIFEEGWDRLRASTGSDEEALRESVVRYEQELARLFSFLRISGALPDAVAWSALKADYRRQLLESGTEISLRTALETGFYLAETAPLGDHEAYLRWTAALMQFLISRASINATRPAPDASEDERLQWAYQSLAALEEHDAFHAAFVEWLRSSSHDQTEVEEIVDHQGRLLAHPRFDLILNTSLRWLAMQPPS